MATPPKSVTTVAAAQAVLFSKCERFGRSLMFQRQRSNQVKLHAGTCHQAIHAQAPLGFHRLDLGGVRWSHETMPYCDTLRDTRPDSCDSMRFRPTAAHSVTHDALAALQDMSSTRQEPSSFVVVLVFIRLQQILGKPSLTTFFLLPLTTVISFYDFFANAQNAPSTRLFVEQLTSHGPRDIPKNCLDHQIC